MYNFSHGVTDHDNSLPAIIMVQSSCHRSQCTTVFLSVVSPSLSCLHKAKFIYICLYLLFTFFTAFAVLSNCVRQKKRNTLIPNMSGMSRHSSKILGKIVGIISPTHRLLAWPCKQWHTYLFITLKNVILNVLWTWLAISMDCNYQSFRFRLSAISIYRWRCLAAAKKDDNSTCILQPSLPLSMSSWLWMPFGVLKWWYSTTYELNAFMLSTVLVHKTVQTCTRINDQHVSVVQ